MNDALPSMLEIGDRMIGARHPTYIVAELSANHRGRFDYAVKLIEAAARAGADAVKLQTYTADTMTVPSNAEGFRIESGSPWDGRTLHELYAESHLPWEWHAPLQRVADELGLDLFSTPFDRTAVDFLQRLGVPAFKVSSFEIVDLPLIRRIAGTRKPMILSTGMATLAEIEEAVTAARTAGAKALALLKCTSAYPASPDDAHLRTIPHLAETFHVPVGLSDHTLGSTVSVAAVALGATIVEKHLTLSRSIPTTDRSFSIEPEELTRMVEAIRTAERSLGDVTYDATPSEEPSRTFRRSLYVVADTKKGQVFDRTNVRAIRPGLGLHTRYLEDVLGHRAARDLVRGTPLAWDLIELD
jgi:pseudaminic acid synthase